MDCVTICSSRVDRGGRSHRGAAWPGRRPVTRATSCASPAACSIRASLPMSPWTCSGTTAFRSANTSSSGRTSFRPFPLRSTPSARLCRRCGSATDLDTPRTAAVSTSYEWQIAKSLFASISYTYRRGAHLLRTLNINEPDPVTGLRPRPDAGPVLQFASAGRSTRHAISVTLRRSLTRVSLFGTYTLGSSRSDTDGPYSMAADSTSLEGEFGRAGDDQRHHAVAGGVVSLPGDVSVSALLTASSGRPFNITTGRDDNGDLLFVDRPAVGVPGDAGALVTPFGTFDLSRPAGQPMIDRNTGRRSVADSSSTSVWQRSSSSGARLGRPVEPHHI